MVNQISYENIHLYHCDVKIAVAVGYTANIVFFVFNVVHDSFISDTMFRVQCIEGDNGAFL